MKTLEKWWVHKDLGFNHEEVGIEWDLTDKNGWFNSLLKHMEELNFCQQTCMDMNGNGWLNQLTHQTYVEKCIVQYLLIWSIFETCGIGGVNHEKYGKIGMSKNWTMIWSKFTHEIYGRIWHWPAKKVKIGIEPWNQCLFLSEYDFRFGRQLF